MRGFAAEMKMMFHLARHNMQRAASVQVQDPRSVSTLLVGTIVAQAVAAGSAETLQGLLEAPAAGQVLGGAGM